MGEIWQILSYQYEHTALCKNVKRYDKRKNQTCLLISIEKKCRIRTGVMHSVFHTTQLNYDDIYRTKTTTKKHTHTHTRYFSRFIAFPDGTSTILIVSNKQFIKYPINPATKRFTI